MTTFRMIGGGTHSHRDPQSGKLVGLRKGGTLESADPLDKLFPDRFQRETASGLILPPGFQLPPGFELVAVKADDSRPTPAPSDADSFGETKHDLRAPNGATTGANAKDTPRVPNDFETASASPTAPPEPGAGPEPVGLGDDVSENFPEAFEAQLLVFKQGKNYYVTDAADPEAPLNDQPITRKDDVREFIATQRGGV